MQHRVRCPHCNQSQDRYDRGGRWRDRCVTCHGPLDSTERIVYERLELLTRRLTGRKRIDWSTADEMVQDAVAVLVASWLWPRPTMTPADLATMAMLTDHPERAEAAIGTLLDLGMLRRADGGDLSRTGAVS